MTNASAGVLPSSNVTVRSAVIDKAERILSGVQLGCNPFNNAAAPVTWGLAIEVPLSNLKSLALGPVPSFPNC